MSLSNEAQSSAALPDNQDWELTIATPIGRQRVTLRLRETNGRLEGEAQGKDESVPLEELERDGDRLAWSQRITRPMRLNLRFEVTVDGDQMTGTSKAGRLPTSTVTGVRLAGVAPLPGGLSTSAGSAA